ncbi:MAG: transglutaminase family protein, partial [Methanobrevibacter sp.]|nr:transglutaminase family protein [Candidatus Methanovirga australis]
STTNAKKNDDYIEGLAKNITKNKTTKLEKAEAIFDWVKNNLDYSGYVGTKYGAKKTIIIGRGNCVDTSHALVALLRASDIPARYVNGRCEFIEGELEGKTLSHVWIQVLIDDKWMVADGTYDENKLGYVTNWNPNSHSVYGIYPSL